MKLKYLFTLVVAIGLTACAGPKLQPDYSQTGSQIQIPRDDATLTNGQLLDTINANIVDVDGRLDGLEAIPEAVAGQAWSSVRTYKIGDLVTDPTADPPQVYTSKTNDNIDNLVTDINNWDIPAGDAGVSSFSQLLGNPEDNIPLAAALNDKVAISTIGTAATRAAASNLATPTALPDSSAVTAAIATRQELLAIPSQEEAEAGTSSVGRLWTAERIKQNIVANAPDDQKIAAEMVDSTTLSLSVEDGGIATVDLSNVVASYKLGDVVYSNESCSTNVLYVNGDNTVVRCASSGDLDYLDGTEWTNLPLTSNTLTLDFVDGNAVTDTMTVSSTQYTADVALPGLTGGVSIFVAAGTGREYSCSGVGITGVTSPFIADMTEDRTIQCTYSSDSAEYTEPPVGSTAITSLPYVINVSGDYKLDADLIIASGSGIVIAADNVAIYGQHNSVTHSSTGAGEAIDITAVSSTSVSIYDIEFIQGAYALGGDIAAIKGVVGGSGYLIKDCTFNVIARAADRDSSGIRLSSTGTDNIVTGCAFNMSGVNRFYGFRASGGWRYHHNTATVSNHTCPDTGEYPYVVWVLGNDQEYDNNTFNVLGSSERVNVILGIGSTQYGIRQRANIHDNTFNYASDHGRVVSMDTGTEDWIVADNTFTITSDVSSGNAVYAIRARMESGGSNPSRGHVISGNTITGNSDSDIHGIAIGDSGVETDATDIDIYSNWVQVAGNPLYLYSGACGDLDIYSNYFEATSTRYDRTAVVINGTPLDIMISNNRIYTSQPDGDLLQVSSDLSADVVVCDSPGLDAVGDIRGGGLVTFQTGNCQDPWLGDPQTNTLTIDIIGGNGVDSVTVSGTAYTTDNAVPSLAGDVPVTTTPDTGREASCTGTGITGSTSPYTADMSEDRTIECTFSAESTASTTWIGTTNTAGVPYTSTAPSGYGSAADRVYLTEWTATGLTGTCSVEAVNTFHRTDTWETSNNVMSLAYVNDTLVGRSVELSACASGGWCGDTAGTLSAEGGQVLTIVNGDVVKFGAGGEFDSEQNLGAVFTPNGELHFISAEWVGGEPPASSSGSTISGSSNGFGAILKITCN